MEPEVALIVKYLICFVVSIGVIAVAMSKIYEERLRVRLAVRQGDPYDRRMPWLAWIAFAVGLCTCIIGLVSVAVDHESAKTVAAEQRAVAAETKESAVRQRSRDKDVIEALEAQLHASEVAKAEFRRLANRINTITVWATFDFDGGAPEIGAYSREIETGAAPFLTTEGRLKGRPWLGTQIFPIQATPKSPLYEMLVVRPESPAFPRPERYPGLSYFLSDLTVSVVLTKRVMDVTNSNHWFNIVGRLPDVYASAGGGYRSVVYFLRETRVQAFGMNLDLNSAKRSGELSAVDDLRSAYLYIGVEAGNVMDQVNPIATAIARAAKFRSLRLEINGVALTIPEKELRRLTFAKGSVAYEYKFSDTGIESLRDRARGLPTRDNE